MSIFKDGCSGFLYFQLEAWGSSPNFKTISRTEEVILFRASQLWEWLSEKRCSRMRVAKCLLVSNGFTNITSTTARDHIIIIVIIIVVVIVIIIIVVVVVTKRRVFYMDDEDSERRKTIIFKHCPLMEREGERFRERSSMCCNKFRLHWDEDGQPSSLSLAGLNLRMLKH